VQIFRYRWESFDASAIYRSRAAISVKAPIVAIAHANAVFLPSREGAGMMTLIDIPETGCWEITAHYKGHDLSFVVSVEPEARN
jgi:hypothetical protein